MLDFEKELSNFDSVKELEDVENEIKSFDDIKCILDLLSLIVSYIKNKR